MIPVFGRGQKWSNISAADMNEIADAARMIKGLRGDRNISVSRSATGGLVIGVNREGSIAGVPRAQVFGAQAQENGTADGLLSVKWLDPTGTAYGSAFDVYTFLDKRTTGADMREFKPWIANNDKILIMMLDGGWYLAEQLRQEGQYFLAKTQEAAQADAYISVKFLSPVDNSTETSASAFDATLLFSDAGTAGTSAFPRIATAKKIIITKLGGAWYALPSFVQSTACP